MPKVLKKMKETEQSVSDSKKRKFDNVKKHSKPGTVKKKAVRDEAIIKQIE